MSAEGSGVRRYVMDGDGCHVAANGRVLIEEAVAASDYDALQSQLSAAIAEREGMRAALAALVAANEQRGIDALMDVAAALPAARRALTSRPATDATDAAEQTGGGV